MTTTHRKLLLLSLTIAATAPLALVRAAEDHQHDQHHHHHQAMQQERQLQQSVARYAIPNVTLADSTGKPVALRTLLDTDEPVMLNFIFTSCTAICPVMSSTFSQVQAKNGSLGKPIRLISISIDPEHDTPARLKDYGRQFDAGPQWTMLTGRLEDSITVQRAFDAYRGDKMNHEPATFLRTGKSAPWLRLDGFASADDLLREYRRLSAKVASR